MMINSYGFKFLKPITFIGFLNKCLWRSIFQSSLHKHFDKHSSKIWSLLGFIYSGMITEINSQRRMLDEKQLSYHYQNCVQKFNWWDWNVSKKSKCDTSSGKSYLPLGSSVPHLFSFFYHEGIFKSYWFKKLIVIDVILHNEIKQ